MTMRPISDAEFAVLRLLARRGAWVEFTASGPIMHPPLRAKASPGPSVTRELLDRLAAHEVVAIAGNEARLTRRGRDLVRRRLASKKAAPVSRTASSRQSASRPHAAQRASCQTALEWLRRRQDGNGEPMITDTLFDAGERLRADWFFAGLDQPVTVNWELGQPSSVGGPAAGTLSDRRLDARDRVHRALGAVGPALAQVLVAICCEDRRLVAIERAAGWPDRSAKIVVRIGLEMLAVHYGMLRHASVMDAARGSSTAVRPRRSHRP
jgi:hypothetical protein